MYVDDILADIDERSQDKVENWGYFACPSCKKRGVFPLTSILNECIFCGHTYDGDGTWSPIPKGVSKEEYNQLDPCFRCGTRMSKTETCTSCYVPEMFNWPIKTEDQQIIGCELCERDNVELTEHHLIPKQKAQNVYKINGLERQNKVYLCKPCHKQVHALFDNRELKQKYNTIQKLKAHPAIIKFVEWVRKKNSRNIKHHGKELKRRE